MSEVRRVTDDDGDAIRVAHDSGQVYLGIGDRAVRLNPAQQEEFAQVYVAECHAAAADAAGAHGPGCYCPDCNAERREEALDAAEIAADRRERLDID